MKKFINKWLITPKSPFEDKKSYTWDEVVQRLEWKKKNKSFLHKTFNYISYKVEKIYKYIIRIPFNIGEYFHLANHGWKKSDFIDIPLAFSPRMAELLKFYKKKTNGYPSSMSQHEWNNILDDMIFYHENHKNFYPNYLYERAKSDPEMIRMRRGKYYFYKYYDNLWD